MSIGRVWKTSIYTLNILKNGQLEREKNAKNKASMRKKPNISKTEKGMISGGLTSERKAVSWEVPLM